MTPSIKTAMLRVGYCAGPVATGSRRKIEAALDTSVVLVGGEEAEVLLSLSPAGVPPRVESSSQPVLCVVDEARKARSRELLLAGASGIITYERLERGLVSALHAVAAGLVVVPADSRPSVVPPALSLREKQILGLVVMGLTNATIAARLFIAESTVKYHLYAIYGKLGVRTRREAADVALDPANGLSRGVIHMSGPPESFPGGYRAPMVA